MSFLQTLIGKKLTPEEQVKKWRQSIRGQDRELDKSLRSIVSEELKTQRLIKQSAKRNDAASCKLLALELVRARKQKDRIHTSKAQLNSLVLVMTQQLATLKVAGAFEKSGEVMGLVNKLVRLPEVSATMMELSKEMVKAGMMDEMVQDVMAMGDEDEIEEEADAEVDKILFDMTDGLLGQAGQVGEELKTSPVADKTAALKARMAALKE